MQKMLNRYTEKEKFSTIAGDAAIDAKLKKLKRQV